MAERTGDRRLDALLAEFAAGEYEWYDELAEEEIDEVPLWPVAHLRDPENAAWRCGAVAHQLVQFLRRHGVRALAWCTDDIASFGYENNGIGPSDDHAAVKVECEAGTFLIDFTASQYGYDEFPVVQRLADDGRWQQQWRPALTDDASSPRHLQWQAPIFSPGLADE